MKKFLLITFFQPIFLIIKSQSLHDFADSIRIHYNIPEVAFAIVSADTIFDLHVCGVQRINTNYAAKITDRFHIGSNTKAITSCIAALLVEQHKINWNTKFFDLFPEIRPSSFKAYQNLTLQNLLTFRGLLPAYTYTFNQPTKNEITGNKAQQRFLLAKYFLSQKPMKPENGLTPSNADYVLAGLMLERATKKSYKELVAELGEKLAINFGFDYPNLTDSLQPWGNDIDLKTMQPSYNHKLNWLLSAGNINVDIPGYIKFIQLQLNGLDGNAKLLSPGTYNKLLFGLPIFSFGWFNKFDSSAKQHIAYNEGNAGAFITQVEVVKETHKAFIIFTNSATNETETGINALMKELKKRYNN